MSPLAVWTLRGAAAVFAILAVASLISPSATLGPHGLDLSRAPPAAFAELRAYYFGTWGVLAATVWTRAHGGKADLERGLMTAGGLVALGLNVTSFKPFVFTIDTSTFKPTIVAGFDAYSVFNGISAWDPLRRTIYGIAQVSKTVKDPALVGYSLHDQTKLNVRMMVSAAPFNLDFFPGSS